MSQQSEYVKMRKKQIYSFLLHTFVCICICFLLRPLSYSLAYRNAHASLPTDIFRSVFERRIQPSSSSSPPRRSCPRGRVYSLAITWRPKPLLNIRANGIRFAGVRLGLIFALLNKATPGGGMWDTARGNYSFSRTWGETKTVKLRHQRSSSYWTLCFKVSAFKACVR